ncbi:thioredoxin domain-containing protein [Tautonia rosea]|uniref:thioredoxin domain-containing protein n=1 Tax=Tautonia rosea TaxID=2728037 RepID=UPI00147528DC|nr:thioredoxin domain-containing protein [Tautonia rosea]
MRPSILSVPTPLAIQRRTAHPLMLLPAFVMLLTATGPHLLANDGPNRLAGESSPYLLQHAENPVHWFPWAPEAFEAAKAQNKPIFLSIGYRSCYWCHVMERECFEDDAIAALMNEHFICIKVDREERPDVDQIYMTALLGITRGSGGWPLSMFLTPDGRPFYGGTYFPPQPRDGLPSFPQVLDAIHDAWTNRRDEVEQDATQLTAYVRRLSDVGPAIEDVPLSRELPEQGLDALSRRFDPEYGGFGFDPQQPKRPKFPEPTNLVFLLDQARRGRAPAGSLPEPKEMVLKTLDQISRGGIRDHLAGGYHRYSTDRSWTVPHFEKMLYDNAQLASVLLDTFELTDDPRWADEARATLDFVAKAMTLPQGGFASSLDAETEGEEGAFYVWTTEEVKTALGNDDSAYNLFARAYGLNLAPNFEDDRFVLLRPDTPGDLAVALGLAPEHVEDSLAPLRAKMLDARNQREAPFLDDTALTAWNALMLAAFADGARVLDEPCYLAIANRAADFLLESLRDADGNLLRSFRGGSSRVPAYLEDYAFLIHGLLRLHAATDAPERLDQARDLADRMIAAFADTRRGGFYFTADDHESLVARVKDPYDGALPGPNAVAILDLLALHRLSGDPLYRDTARDALDAFAPSMGRSPASAPLLLLAVDQLLDLENATPAPPANAPFTPGRLRLPDGPANPAANRPAVVSASASLPQEPIRPGTPFEIRVTLSIDTKYHLNANPAGAPNLVPTLITLPDDSPAELLDVSYPPGAPLTLAGQDAPISVYSGTVTSVVRLSIPESQKADPLGLTLSIRYQACDDRSCLAPASITLPVSLKVTQP